MTNHANTEKTLLTRVWVKFLATLILSLFITAVIFFFINSGQLETALAHLVFELGIIFVVSATFVLVWFNYDKSTNNSRLLAFTFLVITILQAHHIYLSGLKDYLAYDFWLWSRTLFAAVFCYISQYRFKYFINKWQGLVLSISFSAASIHFLRILNAYDRYLFEDHYWLSIILLLALYIITLRNTRIYLGTKSYPTYQYLYLYLLTSLPADLMLASPIRLWSFLYIAGHVFKLISYYYLFKGVFVSAIIHPYELLEGNERLLRSLLDGIPAAMLMYDADYRLNFANQRALELLGCQLQDILGMTNREIVDMFYEDYPDYTLLMLVDESQRPIENVVHRIVTQKGEELKVKIDARKLPDGGFLVTFNEVIKEQELGNLQIQTQTILNSLHNLVLLADKKNRILMCNRAFEEVMEIPGDEAVTMTLRDLYHKLQIEADLDDLSDPNKMYEIKCTTPSGQTRYLLFQLAPVYNVDNERIGSIVVASNITVIKEQQLQLQQQDKLATLGQMAVGIVHEIRNPLTVIKGFSQLIKHLATDERLQAYASEIDKESTELNRVVGDFLAFAKPQPPVFKETSLNEIVKGILPMLESSSFVHGVTMDIDLTRKECLVRADSRQIRQVIMNLVKNAIEATVDRPNPAVKISTYLDTDTDEAVLEVRDNGYGMTEEEQSKVGTPFYTTKDKGTGLGLSICYQLIGEHGGRMQLSSKPNQGTVITVRLPLLVEDNTAKRQAMQ